MKRVSIIIVTYNDEAYIERTIRSAAEQATSQIHVEVIVVDNASTDATVDRIKDLQTSIELQLVTNKQNPGGPSAARNAALKSANGEFVVFLDGDDYLLPHALTKHFILRRHQPDAVVTYTDCFTETDGDILTRRRLSLDWTPPSGDMFEHLLRRNCIAIHTAVVPTAVARKNLFRTDINQAEDYDFWLRISKAGNAFAYLDEPLAVYNRQSDSLSQPSLATLTIVRNVLQGYGEPLSPQGLINWRAHMRDLTISMMEYQISTGNLKAARALLTEAESYGRLGKRYVVVRAGYSVSPALGDWLARLLYRRV